MQNIKKLGVLFLNTSLERAQLDILISGAFYSWIYLILFKPLSAGTNGKKTKIQNSFSSQLTEEHSIRNCDLLTTEVRICGIHFS